MTHNSYFGHAGSSDPVALMADKYARFSRNWENCYKEVQRLRMALWETSGVLQGRYRSVSTWEKCCRWDTLYTQLAFDSVHFRPGSLDEIHLTLVLTHFREIPFHCGVYRGSEKSTGRFPESRYGPSRASQKWRLEEFLAGWRRSLGRLWQSF